MKILFIKYAAIGDVLNATPAIRALRHRYPEARIDCLIGEWSAQVLESNPYVGELIVFDEKIFSQKDFRRMWKLAMRLRRNKYDMTICLHRNLGFHAWTRLIGAKRRLGFINNAKARHFLTDYLVEDDYSRSRQHEIQYYNELILKTGADDGVTMDFFLGDPTPAVEGFLAEHFSSSRPRIGICAGGARNLVSTETRRQWFLESYLETMKAMPDCDFVLFGADFDRYTVEAARNAGLENVVDAVGRFNLRESGQVIKRCDAFITHDTGLMHIASALDVPQVCIFGPTSPARRAPLNKNRILLYTAETCSPCYKPTENAFSPCDHISCLHRLTPQMAVSALRRVLREFSIRNLAGEAHGEHEGK